MAVLNKIACLVLVFAPLAISEGNVACSKIINPAKEILAEYCAVQINDGTKHFSPEWAFKLKQKLDTLERIFPYEYECIRECDWQSYSPFFQFKVEPNPNNRFYFLSGFSIIHSSSHPRKNRKIKDYYEYYKELGEELYITLPPIPDNFEHYIDLDSNFNGFFVVHWDVSFLCPPEDKRMTAFSGTYKIRVMEICEDE